VAVAVSSLDAVFREASAEARVEGLPLSHLSVELGHLYMEDFESGPGHLHQHFQAIAPWVAAAKESCAASLPPGRKARISTCFLIDDYFTQFSSPAVVVAQILEAAEASGLALDYLAREAGCAHAGSVSPARLVEGRLVAEPPPGTNGDRPAVADSGWLSNGERSPGSGSSPAMGSRAPRWRPPSQNDRTRHSIFVDVELWDKDGDERTWSCPFLAAVWQLLRLGMLRDSGKVIVPSEPMPAELPKEWSRLPAIVQVNPAARPFAAYRTLSILAPRFLPVEHAVRTVLSQVAVERDLQRELAARSRSDGIEVPDELVERIEYAFVGSTRALP
jgi:hypothetical protein